MFAEEWKAGIVGPYHHLPDDEFYLLYQCVRGTPARAVCRRCSWHARISDAAECGYSRLVDRGVVPFIGTAPSCFFKRSRRSP